MGRAAHRDGVGAGRALGRRGRCVPDPRAQRVRRPLGRARGCSRSARRATLFLAAGWLLPWMRAPLPRRDWRKVVAATQGIVLTVAAADVVPPTLMQAALAVALALLAESFGRDVWWLWRHRHAADRARGVEAGRGHAPAGRRRAHASSPSCVVWVALVAPDQPRPAHARRVRAAPARGHRRRRAGPRAPRRPARRVLAVVVGPVLGLLVIVKLLDIGFFTAFDRPFNPVDDWSYTSIGIETLRDSIGRTDANLALVGVVAAHRRGARPPDAGGAAPDAGRGPPPPAGRSGRSRRSAPSGCSAGRSARSSSPARRIASTSAADLAVQEVHAVQTGLRDQRAVRPRDPPRPLPRHARRPAADRPARQGRPARVRRELREGRGPGLVLLAGGRRRPRHGDAQLAAAGFSSRSGWLTSSTFGGTQLAGALHPAVGDLGRQPAALRPARRERPPHAQPGVRARPGGGRSTTCRRTTGTGRRGRRSTTTTRSTTAATSATAARRTRTPPMPDQYVLAALQRLELAKRRPPAALRRGRPGVEPHAVDAHPAAHPVGATSATARSSTGSPRVDEIRALQRRHTAGAYGTSIEYTLSTLVLVRAALRPTRTSCSSCSATISRRTIVTGHGATHDVPISVIAHDPAVMRRIAGWGWGDGMRPSPTAPVWPMSAFRDRFLGAFGSQPRPGGPG